MQTYDLLAFSISVSFAHALAQITFRKPAFRPIATSRGNTFPDIQYAWCWSWGVYFRALKLKDPQPFDLVSDALDPKRTGRLLFENIMFTYPTRSGVNVLEDFNLEVKVDDKVTFVHTISETSQSKLFSPEHGKE